MTLFYCEYCRSQCTDMCYATHSMAFKCHNQRCPGHKSQAMAEYERVRHSYRRPHITVPSPDVPGAAGSYYLQNGYYQGGGHQYQRGYQLPASHGPYPAESSYYGVNDSRYDAGGPIIRIRRSDSHAEGHHHGSGESHHDNHRPAHRARRESSSRDDRGHGGSRKGKSRKGKKPRRPNEIEEVEESSSESEPQTKLLTY